jgi:hypothetical protein
MEVKAMSLKIDRQIQKIDEAICRNIGQFDVSGRGEVSQDILQYLRNFVEHIMLKIYAKGNDIEDNYENIKSAVKDLKQIAKWKDLNRFHHLLQISVSHYTVDKENSERLMLKYYEYLLIIKKLLCDEFSINILANLDKFPLNTDKTLQKYYEKIAEEINLHSYTSVASSDKFYIQKIKPFFVNNQIYYEVTFTPANDYANKFNRVIAFTNLKITDFYAVKFSLANASIEILNKTMPITIITGWEVAIRSCEFKNFTSIVRGSAVATEYSEQKGVCRFLTETGLNLVELIDFSNTEFQEIKSIATRRAKTIVFFKDLERCRDIIKNGLEGSNLLRYLLYHMNNKVIKNQRQDLANNYLSRLYARNGCIPFDNMPFNFSPIGHNPRLGDLFACIDATGRQHEIFARFIRNNTEMQGQLFTTVKDIAGFDDIPTLVSTYNSKLYSKHEENSKLVIRNGQVFINGYLNDTIAIINKLRELAKSGIRNYVDSVKAWLTEPTCGVDCEEKKEVLTRIFENSHVALIYGSAGTGKSTLINHIALFFAGYKKLFLAQTNSAIDNLKRRVTASNSIFLTIAKFLKKNSSVIKEYDLLIIDECSTVSNSDMRDIINQAKYKLLILVGDSYQIASIRFGNWFSVASEFIPKTSVYELTKPYRSKDLSLLKLWNRVRNMDDNILELITRQDYSTTLDDSILVPANADEIILCLNYDGFYGINNINNFLQESNPNKAVKWGIQQYKVNDPILFNDSERFAPVIYNNMKGRIAKIEILNSGEFSECIQFDIELEKIINGMDAQGKDFELLDNSESGNSVIRFCVHKEKSTDEDDEGFSGSVVPFQIAYAVSIHKAQGLEYNSVKIVITDEIDELINHSIFYTAITRARSNLKIYWTPEVEQKVLCNLKQKNSSKDVLLLKNILKV